MNRRRFVGGAAAGLGAVALGPLPRLGGPPAPGLPAAGPRARSVPGATDDERMAWWREARFGLFIHWGLYSILAGERMGRTDHAEWIRNTAHIPLAEYDKLVQRFNPTRFDADQWVGMAKDAGMKYVTITSKHHDGFCLFDNRLTTFCIRSTPFKRDIMTATTCRAATGRRPRGRWTGRVSAATSSTCTARWRSCSRITATSA
jgi:hypothetical protein